MGEKTEYQADLHFSMLKGPESWGTWSLLKAAARMPYPVAYSPLYS